MVSKLQNNSKENIYEYLKAKGYSYEEADLLLIYLESIIVPIFDNHFNKLYKQE